MFILKPKNCRVSKPVVSDGYSSIPSWALQALCRVRGKRKCINPRKAFGRLAISAAIALILAGWNAWPVHAEHLNFTLYNKSGKTIANVYVSRTDTDVWGEDVLGQSVLQSGESRRINFPGQNPESPCSWDIKVIYDDGTSAEMRSHDLCQSNNSVFAQDADQSESDADSSENNDDCESKYQFHEDRMCYCYGICY